MAKCVSCLSTGFIGKIPIYCRVPARRGLQQTARAPTRHGARDTLTT